MGFFNCLQGNDRKLWGKRFLYQPVMLTISCFKLDWFINSLLREILCCVYAVITGNSIICFPPTQLLRMGCCQISFWKLTRVMAQKKRITCTCLTVCFSVHWAQDGDGLLFYSSLNFAPEQVYHRQNKGTSSVLSSKWTVQKWSGVISTQDLQQNLRSSLEWIQAQTRPFVVYLKL